MNKAGLGSLGVVLLLGYFSPPWFKALLLVFVSLFYYWLKPIKPVLETTNKKPSKSLCHDRFHLKKVPEDLDVIIIGGGMSGLSCGALLGRLGKKVVVLEQHTVCGGGSHSFELSSGYRFDSGLHYTVPWSVPLFHLTCLTKDVPVFELLGDETGTFDKVVLGEDEPFNIKHKEAHLEELYKLFPEEHAAIDAYLRISDCVLPSVQFLVLSKLMPPSLRKLFWRVLPRKYKKYMGVTAKEILEELTSNKKLISLLCSLWIDTGGRPDQATFMLTASVFRGLPKEGGCYPVGGSESMARTIVPVIERHGGRVLVRAEVTEIIVENGKACGVRLKNGSEIRSKMVISSVGYHNTFGKLVNEQTTSAFNIPRQLSVDDAPGFLMCNIGIKGGAKELGIDNCNVWYHPVDQHGDIFPKIQSFYQDPLSDDQEPPCMITFGSTKDKGWAAKNPDKTCCQMLVMADWKWFEKYKDLPSGKRGEEYEELKALWAKKCLRILFRFFPQVEDKIELVDVSTPLSIAHYLYSPHGTAVGLDQTPKRYVDEGIQDLLDPVSRIPGLYQTGQDTLICGVTIAQLSGVITAFRICGFANAAKLVLQSVFYL